MLLERLQGGWAEWETLDRKNLGTVAQPLSNCPFGTATPCCSSRQDIVPSITHRLGSHNLIWYRFQALAQFSPAKPLIGMILAIHPL